MHEESLAVCRAIRKRDELLRALHTTEADGQKLRRYNFIQRSRNDRKIAELKSQIENCKMKISPDVVQYLAGMAGARLWQRAAETVIPGKNPYGRAGHQHFEKIFKLVMDQQKDFDLWVGDRSFRLAALSDVQEILTGSYIESKVREIIAERARIAASTNFLNDSYTNSDGNLVVVVQHIESGLRARFTVTEPGFGSVYSKPYSIQSIDPNNPGESLDWQNYVGLGIGVKLYQEGHRLIPGVRWMSSAMSAYSPPLRRKLHAIDPYTWEGRCRWCEDKLAELRIPSWRNTNQQFFADHP